MTGQSLARTASTSTPVVAGTIELGNATDTTLARSGAGDVTIEGNAVYRAGGTDVAVADGGTGRSTATTAYGLLAAGTTATGVHQTLAAGATTEVLVGGGASALPAWTTATGSGAPVRATSPTLVTPALGTPASGTLTNCTDMPYSGVTGLGWGPGDSGYINWSFDPMCCYQGTVLTAGSVYVAAVPIRKATTVTNVIINVYIAGGTLTSGQCFAALYQGGNLLDSTASQHTAWQSTGVKTMALGTPQPVTAGFVYVAFYANGTTKPSISGSITSTIGGVNAFGGTARGGFADTGRTTSMPTTLGAITGSLCAWAAVS